LLRSRVLRHPLLTVSPWFEARRREYQDQLQRVSETGDLDTWVAFFSEAIRVQADATAEKIDRLLAAQEDARELVRQHKLRGVGAAIAEDLISQPVVTVGWAAKHHGVTYPAANTAIFRLTQMGLLREATGGTYGRVFRNEEIMRILES
jgi:Fic family protein